MMRNALATAAIVALGLAMPQIGHAQSSGQPGITIPMPNLGFGNNNREQQAQASDRARHCDDLRRRADDLRYRADNADYRDEARRAEDRLRDVNDQIRRDCNRY
jgi:flagellar motility protein MotE (MotC chaperone)